MLQIHKPSRIPGKIQALKEREKDIYNATSLKPQTWFNFNLKKIKKNNKIPKAKGTQMYLVCFASHQRYSVLK